MGPGKIRESFPLHTSSSSCWFSSTFSRAPNAKRHETRLKRRPVAAKRAQPAPSTDARHPVSTRPANTQHQHRHPASTTCTASSQHQHPAPDAHQHQHRHPVSTTCTASTQHRRRRPVSTTCTASSQHQHRQPVSKAHRQLIVVWSKNPIASLSGEKNSPPVQEPSVLP